jgi:methionyl-tRNA formyltransferase
MKVVILTGDQPNQAALCQKLSAHCDVAAIILSQNVPKKSPPVARRARLLFNSATGRLVGRPFVATWQELQSVYGERYPYFPPAPQVRVRNVNDEATLDALREHDPDLVIVSGTNQVGKRVIEAASRSLGVVNMHTGISPYVKGGPNCTNWCLAEATFHLIGTTVMWLDAGIDTGRIIATEQTPLDGRETLFELHWNVMEHAHDLYVRAIRRLARGEQVPSVAQASIEEGRTFYTVEWDALAMLRARINFKTKYRAHFVRDDERLSLASSLRLFPIEEGDA